MDPPQKVLHQVEEDVWARETLTEHSLKDSSAHSEDSAVERGGTFPSGFGSGLSKTLLWFPEKLTA